MSHSRSLPALYNKHRFLNATLAYDSPVLITIHLIYKYYDREISFKL